MSRENQGNKTQGSQGFRRSAFEKGALKYANIDSLHNLQDDLLRLHKQAYELKDDLTNEIATAKNDLIFDTKNTLYIHEQKLVSTISAQHKEIEHIQNHLLQQTISTRLYERKLNFRLGYCGFVAVNIFILR